MRDNLWLARRALLAVALMIGFYLLAVTIAVVLFAIPYAEYRALQRVDGRIAFWCIAGGLSVIWAMLPRIDRFEPPGPELLPSENPRLFDTIKNVAASADQAMPKHVYLVADANAFVTQRGGLMGFGSVRVMGIGLPLLQMMTVTELKAVVAHEFGHYAAGDVKLGPWIYKTRQSIERTIVGVRYRFLAKPFHWYGNLFLKLTHAVSREQEFLADRLAARIAGPRAMISGLRQAASASIAFQSYLNNEVAPVLNAGFLPPVATGFAEFLRHERVAKMLGEAVEAEQQQASTAFDTHPSVRERIDALNDLPLVSNLEINTQTAIVLLGKPDVAGRQLAAHAFRSLDLKPIDWESVGEEVYAKLWEASVKQSAAHFATMTVDSIPSSRAALLAFAGKLWGDTAAPPDVKLAVATQFIGYAISHRLHAAGWRAHTRPGQRVTLHRAGESIDPRDSVERLIDGRMSVDEWCAQCAMYGIAGQPITATVATV